MHCLHEASHLFSLKLSNLAHVRSWSSSWEEERDTRELKSKEEVKKEISSQIKSFISTTSCTVCTTNHSPLMLTFEVNYLTGEASEYRETQKKFSTFQCLIAPIELGQRLLNEGHPQLLFVSLM